MAKHSYQLDCDCKRCLKERERRKNFVRTDKHVRPVKKSSKSSWENITKTTTLILTIQ